jgi:hypothetical protein
LKTELYNRRDWPTWAQGRPEVACWIEMVYNRRWLHSPLGYQKPVESSITTNN